MQFYELSFVALGLEQRAALHTVLRVPTSRHTTCEVTRVHLLTAVRL